MMQRDFLEKQIDQLGKVLGKIFSDLLGRKKNGLLSDGVEITNQELRKEIELDIPTLIAIPNDQFIDFLIKEKNFNLQSLNQLSDIFLLLADQETSVNQKELYPKCLLIYEYLAEVSEDISLDRQWKIDRLKKEGY